MDSTAAQTGPERQVSASVADWGRERPRRFWDPSRRLLRTIRRYQALRGRRGPLAWLMRKRWAAAHRFWSIITQAEIDLGARIGGGLLIPHPNGIVIHPAAEIGVNCLIFQQVTIGAAGGKARGTARIGGHVDIGAGAKILGPVQIGDHTVIGANAVVVQDIPDGATAVGIPARILRQDS